ncbi:kelch-like protein 40 [Styela clava]
MAKYSKSTQTSHIEQCESIGQEWLLMKGAQELRANDILVDVVLIVDGVKLQPCHKFVLAASSPYFRAMFSHGMAEQNKKEIEIMDVDRRSLQLVLDYIYTSQVSISDKNVQGLMTTCSLLQITGLYGKCREYMIRRLDITNCVSVYQFARSMYSTKLEDEAFRFIARRFKDVSNMEEFLSLSKDEFIDVISSDDVWITKEEYVYEAAIRWLAGNISRCCHVAEIFSHVRFALLDEDYLDSCVLQEEIILEYPHLRSQVEAAKTYITKAKNLQNKKNTEEFYDQTSSDVSENSDVESRFPSYTISIEGLENTVRIPLNLRPRAGMNTKEYLLFTNGRKTFVMNPDCSAEYYGCMDNNHTDINSNREERSAIGWSPNLPLMKNPEAYVATDGTTFLLGGLEVEKTMPPDVRTRVHTLEQDALSWTACTSMPIPRCMAAYGDGCGHFYVLGGKALAQGEVVSTVHKYSRIENEWEEVNPMPIAVYGHGSASIHDKIYTIGGKTTAKVLLSNVHYLDCITHQWTEIESITVPRFLHGVTVNRETEEFIVVGGSSEEGVLNSVEVFNLLERRWKFGESFPGNRCAQFVTYFKEELHAVGGYVTERTDGGRYESREMHDIFALEDESNQWIRKTRRVRGTVGGSLACVKVSLNVTKLPRARTA